ncbi:MAG: hypothetical protein ACYCZX_04665 [Rhodospirillaceae bacterium]
MGKNIFLIILLFAMLYLGLWAERAFGYHLKRIVDKYRAKSEAGADEGGVWARGANQRQRTTICWNDIVEVDAFAVDKITYRENFLRLKDANGGGVSIGELDEGFADVLEMIKGKFPGFQPDWYGRLETGQPGERMIIWTKENSKSTQGAVT